MLSVSWMIKCFLFHLPQHLKKDCQKWLSAGGRQELRAASSLDQYTFCRTLPSSWPHRRGDLMLDIEFHSGSRTEHLPHARLWALEHDSDMTPALRGFTEQCGQLTHKQMTLSRMLKSEH